MVSALFVRDFICLIKKSFYMYLSLVYHHFCDIFTNSSVTIESSHNSTDCEKDFHRIRLIDNLSDNSVLQSNRAYYEN